MRGRKPTPTALKILHGNPGKRRLPDNEVQPPSEIPEPPDHLDDAAKKEWARITELLSQLGLIARLDMAGIAAYCVAFSRWADAERKVAKHGIIVMSPDKKFPMKSPYLSVAESAMEAMRKMLAEFGLTPSSRTRLSCGVKPLDKLSKYTGYQSRVAYRRR
jgi:P27 family predicted phage terminase small subunit